jgi:hypothetical protein
MHPLVYCAPNSGAEARQATAHFARILHKLAQGVCQDVPAVQTADTDKSCEVARCHLCLLYFESESRTLNGFIKEGLETLGFDIQETRKIGPPRVTIRI